MAWRTYFDHNFGVLIDSAEKLREIEKKQKGQYYSVNEFLDLNKKKEKERIQKEEKYTQHKFQEITKQIKWGRSFVRENRQKGIK